MLSECTVRTIFCFNMSEEDVAAAATVSHFFAHPFRPQFLQSPGRPPITWSRWLAMFDDWMQAIGFPTTPTFAARKAALLRASLGPEGARIYYSLAKETNEPFQIVVDRMERHFGRPASVIFNRALFTRSLQRPGESILQYLSTLREMARKCDFRDDQFDERVRDQFAAGCANDRIRERLLQEPGTKTLEDLENLAMTMERAQREAPVLASSSSSSSGALVNYVTNNRKQRPSSSASSSISSSVKCTNCGRTGHASKAVTCPARGKTCDTCGKPGHFASVCRSSGQASSSTSGRVGGRHRQRSQSRSRRTNQIECDPSDDVTVEADMIRCVTINAVHTAEPGAFKSLRCQLNGVAIELMLDLGAKVSILSRSVYNASLSTLPLRSSNVTLSTYSGTLIPCLGRVFVTVRFDNRMVDQFPFYVTERGASIMGVDLFDALGGSILLGDASIVTKSSMIATIHPDQSSVALESYPVLLKASGTLKGFVHRPLVDPSVRPVQQKFWHPPLARREPIAAELRRMEASGVIERIDASPWTSNVVAAKKKDGSLRLCVNLTSVNKALILDRYPLPTMDELTAKLTGSTVFSKIDLLWGYLQLPLASECRYLTAFVTHEGVWQFKSLPFGLATGPSAFHQVIRTILHGLDGCVSILDDILVYGRSMAEHDERLRRVLDRLVLHNATVRRDKCIIGAAEVEFNGHHVSGTGVKPLLSNVAAILNIPVPVDARQLLRFVCTASYYMKFIPGFAALCEPLRRLLKADAVWNWSAGCQTSFDELKKRVSQPPVLAHFDSSAPTFITCDASAVALGALLSQQQGGEERPIAFASRTLSPAERNYSTSEREALACLWACEHWHFYVYGRQFTLITDHQALKTLLSSGGSGHRPLRLHRWADRLFQYNFSVVYRPGRFNVVADCLSRAFDTATTATPEVHLTFDDGDDVTDDSVSDDCLVQSIFGSLATPVVTLDAVAAATTVDPELQAVMMYVRQGWPTAKSAVPLPLRPFYDLQAEFSLVFGGRCLLRGCRVVIPPSLRSTLLELAHEGHPGIARMKAKCREAIWWPGVDADVERFVRDCQPCVVSGKSVRPSPGPLHPVPLPSGPWRKLSLDIAGEFVAAPRAHRYMLVAIDYFSKWPEAATCEYVTSSAVITFLTTLFDRFGLVEEIVTDNGPQFISSEFTSFLSSLGIRHSRSALYSPQTNSEVERFNRVMKEGLKTGLADGRDFVTAVRHTLASYRATPHCATGVTPASLMLSFPLRTPLTLLQQSAMTSSTSSSAPPTPSPIAARVRFRQQLMASDHDARHHAKPTCLSAGDRVRIKVPNRAHKLAPVYSDPMLVTKVVGNTVWLENGQRWNVRRCLPCRSSLRQGSTSTASVTSSNTPSPLADTEIPDVQGAMFAFRLPTPPRPAAVAAELRRSGRTRRPRDLGPVISH